MSPDTHDERGMAGARALLASSSKRTRFGRVFVEHLLAEHDDLREQLAAATEQAGLAEAQATDIQAERNEWQRRAQRGHAVAEILRAELAAATARAEKAGAALAEANGRADKFCGAFSDAGSLAYRRGKLLDAALTRQTELAKERDEARELACASLDILRNVSDEPMRELFEVDDMDEMPAWFTGYGKRSDAEGAEGAQDGLSEPVERSEVSDGHGEGSNSSAGAVGLSEAEAPRDTTAWCWAPNPHTLLHCGLLRDHEPPHRRGERTWTDDNTTEDRR